MDLYYFGNYQYQNLSLDFLKGLFNAFEFLNHAPNQGFDFDIAEYETVHNQVDDVILSQIPTDENISYSLIEMTKQKFEKSLQNWFFHFVQGITAPKRGTNNFFEPKEQTEFIYQMMNLIEKIMQPISFHAVQTSQFSYAFGITHDWFIIIAKDKFYNLRLSWSD